MKVARGAQFALSLIAIVLLARGAGGFTAAGRSWASGPIPVSLQLAGERTLVDGSAGFNAAAASALTLWNENLGRVQFAPASQSPAVGNDGDGVNQVFFDSSSYGESFGAGTLAMSTIWSVDSQIVETDVVFNTAFTWDSYRGAKGTKRAYDLRRVALHEFGHMLGLTHPDDNGERVIAIMNRQTGGLDTLSADDITGALSLYGPVPRRP